MLEASVLWWQKEVINSVQPSASNVVPKTMRTTRPGVKESVQGRRRYYVSSEDEIYLTSRERDIAAYLFKFATYKVIGGCLGISERTVECHVKRMREKLECKNKLELVKKLRLHHLGLNLSFDAA